MITPPVWRMCSVCGSRVGRPTPSSRGNRSADILRRKPQNQARMTSPDSISRCSCSKDQISKQLALKSKKKRRVCRLQQPPKLAMCATTSQCSGYDMSSLKECAKDNVSQVLLTPLQHRELLLSGGDLRIELKVDRDNAICG